MSDAPVAVAPPPPPPFKNRRGWLIAFGIFEILMGCILLAVIALLFFAARNIPSKELPPNPAASMAMVVALYGGMAIFFVVVGIGSVQLRRWTRMAMLIVSWCWLGIGILGIAMVAFMMPLITQGAQSTSGAPMPPDEAVFIKIFMFSVLGFLFILLPTIFLLFYSGKNVKATLNAAAVSGMPAVRKPVPVIVAAAWFGLGTFCFFVFLQRPAYPFFGFIIVGWKALLTAGLSSLVSGWLVWSLYHQRKIACRSAVAWLLLNWLSLLATLARYDLIEMYRRMGFTEAEVAQMMPMVAYAIYIGWILGIAFFVFLIAIRKQFDQPTPAAA